MKALFINGKIFTASQDRPFAEAMLVSRGRIEAAGTEAEVRSACPESSNVVDLGGRRVIPGLIDSHMHGIILSDYSKQISCLPPQVNSIAGMIERIRTVCREKAAGEWILGWGYDEGKLAEHRAPDRRDLDRATTEHPVFIARTCLHIASVNSKALELAGITADTPDPEGGHIVRDEEGNPTGVLQENARNLVLSIMPEKSSSEKTNDLADLGELLLSQGIIAFSDMGAFDPVDTYEDYLAATTKGLRQDVAVYYMWDQVRGAGAYTLDETALDPAKQIHVAGLKLIGDGSISGHTAWVDEPYLGTDEHGICELDEEMMKEALALAEEHDCQLSVHAMGSRTIAAVIDRLAATGRKSLRRCSAPAFRMEHITEPSSDSIDKAAACGIWFSLQPIFQYSEIESYLANLGQERTKKTYPVRTLLGRGVNLSLSTDAPATAWAYPSDPWINLQAAVTRIACDGTDCGRDQSVDVAEAISLYTRKAAQICGFPLLGQLSPGFRASFLVLSQDPFELPPESIGQVKVARTYMDGDPVYDMSR